jgi:ATP-dependent DNA helicase RecG
MNLSIDLLESMTPEAVTTALLSEPEGQWYDRKSARITARELAKALVAMANAEGGLLAVGLHRGSCEGVDSSANRQNDWRQAGLDFTDPPVRFDARLIDCVNAKGQPDHLFVIEVAPGKEVYATRSDEAYVRSGDENRKLSFDQRIDLRYDRGDTTFEARPQRELDDSALDARLVSDYAQRLGHEPDRLLHARDLLASDGSPTTAGLLLFGREPQRVFPHARLRVLRCAGTEWRTGSSQNLVYDRTFEGTLPEQIDTAMQAMSEIVPQYRALGAEGRFEWFGLVPQEAWLEALVNAVIHRAYSNYGDHIRLIVFDDRIEVESPGRFPGLSSPRDLTKVRRYARNPRIARVMAELDYGQELGEGLRRMVDAMESRGQRRPLLQETAGGVNLTLFGTLDVPDELANLPQLARSIYGWIERSGQLRTGEIAALAGVARPTALRYLGTLEQRQLIARRGSSRTDPTAYWEVV